MSQIHARLHWIPTDLPLHQQGFRQGARPMAMRSAAAMRPAPFLSAFQTRLLSDTTRQAIEKAVASAPVVLFMKGTPETPQCGFSRASIQILGLQCVDPNKFAAFNVLEDEELRSGKQDGSETGIESRKRTSRQIADHSSSSQASKSSPTGRRSPSCTSRRNSWAGATSWSRCTRTARWPRCSRARASSLPRRRASPTPNKVDPMGGVNRCYFFAWRASGRLYEFSLEGARGCLYITRCNSINLMHITCSSSSTLHAPMSLKYFCRLLIYTSHHRLKAAAKYPNASPPGRTAEISIRLIYPFIAGRRHHRLAYRCPPTRCPCSRRHRRSSG